MISETELLTPEEASACAEKVHELRRYWFERPAGSGRFYTLGASAYIDGERDRQDYFLRADGLNKVLFEHFSELLSRTAQALEHGRDYHCAFAFNIGLPGFHIFGSDSNGLQASIHKDRPHETLFGHIEPEEVISFTVPLQLPSFGGGLYWWEGDITETEVMPDRYLQEYEIGKLYTHHGQWHHQIASLGDMSPDEYRITLQGHGIRLKETDSMVLYF